jgi:hypothetical protein
MSRWRDEIRRRLADAKLDPTREAAIAQELEQHLEDRYAEHGRRHSPSSRTTIACVRS